MSKFSEKVLETINILSDDTLTLEEASDFNKVDLSVFSLEDSSLIEFGGFIPFGKKLDREGCFLSIDSFRNRWDNLK